MDASQVDFGVLNGVGTLSLRREAALNALTLDMVRDCRRVVRGCGEDEQVKAVVVRGEGDKAFCAGGDVRRLAGRPEEALRFFKEEYGLDWQIRELRKPVVALMDGIVMGGGAGIATNCTYRIVSDKTVFAMPEVAIGLMPDVGGSYFLSRCKPNHQTGLFLALTGYRMSPAEVMYTGIGTHFVHSDNVKDMLQAFYSYPWTDKKSAWIQVEEIIARFASKDHLSIENSILFKNQQEIEKLFGKNSIEAVMAAVEDSITEFGRWCFNQMSAKKSSPLSLKVAFKAFQMGRELSLEEVFRMELRVATRLVQDFPDFRNGVKALLVEKKGHPKWSHSLVTQVDEKAIQQIFSPFSNEEMEWKPN